MAEIYLLSCVKLKRDHMCKAEALYTSPFFKKSLEYAKNHKPDKIFILSAKYGLLGLSDVVEPYEKTLNKMRKAEREEWADKVIDQLRKETDPEKDSFTFLAGQRYRENLLPALKNYQIPMSGLAFGEQLQWLEKNKNNE
jgi:cytoplasmic iron level regulating protein YaaA (DUF328/UPF0246 family)